MINKQTNKQLKERNKMISNIQLTEEEKDEYADKLEEWKEIQFIKRKHEFSTQHFNNFLLITFNINEKVLPQKSIDKLFNFETSYSIDFIVINIQEIDMSVSGFLKGNTVISKSTDLCESIMKSINKKFKEEYLQLSLLQLGGVVLMIFCRNGLKNCIKNISTGYEAVGAMGMANKGGIAFSFQCYDTWICIVGSHLAAHQQEVMKRNKNFSDIYNNIVLNQIDTNQNNSNKDNKNHWNQFQHTGNYCQKIKQHDIILWLGDLNYRIDEEDLIIRQKIQSNTILELLETHDQLYTQMKSNELLREFKEFKITFPPTYKFITMTDEYNEKRRPAYCDRLLYKINHKLDIQCLEYSSIPEIKESDHRPVRGIFSIETESIQFDQFSKIAEEIGMKESVLQKMYKPSILCDKRDFDLEVYPFETQETSMNLINNGNAKIHIEFSTVDNNKVLLNNTDMNEHELVKYKTFPEWLTITPNKLVIEKDDYSMHKIIFKIRFNFIRTQHLFNENDEFVYNLIMKVTGRNDIFLTFNFSLKPTSLNKSIDDMILHPNGYTNFQPIMYSPLSIPKEIWRLCDRLLSHCHEEDLLREFIPSESHANEYLEILEDLDNHQEFRKDYKYHRLLELLYLYLINLKQSIIPSEYISNAVDAVVQSDEEIEKFFQKYKTSISLSHFNLFVYIISFMKYIITVNPSINSNNGLVRFFLPCIFNLGNRKLSQRDNQALEYFIAYYMNKIE